MASVKMMQGDSYAVFVALQLKDSGSVITPDMVSDVEVYVGDSIRKLYSAGEVRYDDTMLQWYFIPTQEETFGLEPGGYPVQVRVKFRNGAYSFIKGIEVGALTIVDANSEEVI